MRSQILSTEEIHCNRCDAELTYEDESLYSEWEFLDGSGVFYEHNDENCDEAPKMSYYNKCNCCDLQFDISELEFDVDEDKNIYCSISCRKKHIACLANVEEPDIVY
jgi:hypothetical protein